MDDQTNWPSEGFPGMPDDQQHHQASQSMSSYSLQGDYGSLPYHNQFMGLNVDPLAEMAQYSFQTGESKYNALRGASTDIATGDKQMSPSNMMDAGRRHTTSALPYSGMMQNEGGSTSSARTRCPRQGARATATSGPTQADPSSANPSVAQI